MEPVSDAELVRRCCAGDDAAWALLVERYARYVHAVAVRAYRLPPADAEDVFQETFARVYERLGTLRDPDALRPWIGQLARRQCLDRLRAGAREAPAAEATLEREATPVLEPLEQAWDVHGALATLSPDCQEVLDRFFCRDESYHTIGAELGLPPGTIASRISRCLARLRETLEGRTGPAGASRKR